MPVRGEQGAEAMGLPHEENDEIRCKDIIDISDILDVLSIARELRSWAMPFIFDNPTLHDLIEGMAEGLENYAREVLR